MNKKRAMETAQSFLDILGHENYRVETHYRAVETKGLFKGEDEPTAYITIQAIPPEEK